MRPLATALLSVLLLVHLASAATIHVPGDQPTIQAGIDAASAGDTILVAQGIYTGEGNRGIDFRGKNVVARSSGGPAVTAIDCEGSGRAVTFQTGEDSTAVLEGFTITHAQGAVLCWRTSPKITGCIFADNSGDGAAIRSDGVYGSYNRPILEQCSFVDNAAGTQGTGYFSYSSPRITDCSFTGNSSSYGGALSVLYGSPIILNCTFERNSTHTDGVGGAIRFHSPIPTGAIVTGCQFRGNSAGGSGGMGGAIHCFSGVLTIDHCTFDQNSAYLGGAIYGTGEWSEMLIRNCTLNGNSATTAGSGICAEFSSPIGVENTVIAFGTQTDGASCRSGGRISLSCCDIYGNEGGDWTGCIADQFGVNGNISADPLFCDAASGDFHLDCSSPCAPAQQPECGLIGAFDVGCGATGTEPSTWGLVKQLFDLPRR